MVRKEGKHEQTVFNCRGYRKNHGVFCHSYKIIKQLNGELTKKGYITRTGRIPRKYFYERTGLDPEEAT